MNESALLDRKKFLHDELIHPSQLTGRTNTQACKTTLIQGYEKYILHHDPFCAIKINIIHPKFFCN